MREEVTGMRVNYEKPSITIEEYQLDTAIAVGCQTIVSLGPTPGEYNGTYYSNVCDCFIKDFATFAEPPAQMNFFETSCSCYLGSGGSTVFTS